MCSSARWSNSQGLGAEEEVHVYMCTMSKQSEPHHHAVPDPALRKPWRLEQHAGLLRPRLVGGSFRTSTQAQMSAHIECPY